jgi:hypothetical protein
MVKSQVQIADSKQMMYSSRRVNSASDDWLEQQTGFIESMQSTCTTFFNPELIQCCRVPDDFVG